jgi:phosphoglycerate dehydrogenase-like enzyme
MRKAALIAVPHDWSKIGHVVAPLGESAFSRVTYGNSVDSFVVEKAKDDPLVVLIGGAGTHEVLKEVLEWKDASGAKRVKWVHSYWTGVDAFRVTALKEQFGQTPLTNARGVFSAMLAEHVVLASLYFNRMVWRLHANRRAKNYERYPCIPGADQTMGIIGYGEIGRAVAKHAIGGMGVKVKGLRSREPDETTDDLGAALLYGPSGLAEILATCDIVVAVLPLTPSTSHMLRREHFQAMKPTAIFINIGRGATIVEDDLVEALQAGEIRGAALDVFEVEPLPASSRLWDVDDSKLLLSPHNADISEHSYADGVLQFAEAAKKFAETNEVPDYRVNLDRGY